MATTFSNLEFAPHPIGMGGVRATVFFPNGYGASVVRFHGSYGGDEGLYELGVLKGRDGDWSLCYDTPITDDVEGHLTPERVTELLAQIEALPAPKEQAA